MILLRWTLETGARRRLPRIRATRWRARGRRPPLQHQRPHRRVRTLNFLHFIWYHRPISFSPLFSQDPFGRSAWAGVDCAAGRGLTPLPRGVKLRGPRWV